MEVIKIQATIKGGILPIPDRILSQIEEGENVEIVFRPLRSAASTGKDVNQAIDDLEKRFQGEFPNLRSPMSHNSLCAGTGCEGARDTFCNVNGL